MSFTVLSSPTLHWTPDTISMKSMNSDEHLDEAFDETFCFDEVSMKFRWTPAATPTFDNPDFHESSSDLGMTGCDKSSTQTIKTKINFRKMDLERVIFLGAL